MTPAVGFIGFGEAGSTIAGGLREAGVETITAYDIATDTPGAGDLIRDRARRTRTRMVGSSAELTGLSEILLSTVTSSSALEAARQTAPHLRGAQLYADLNSISPGLKRRVADIVAQAGGCFVEAAVMAPVRPYQHRVPMLLGGPGAARLVEALARFGMQFDVLGDTVGQAAAVKMCRSIVVKGLEALMLECVLGASRYHAEPHVFASLQKTFPGIDWRHLADYTTNRVVVHGARRAREMEEVAETLRAEGVDPLMAEATARRQAWCAALDLTSRFGPDGPRDYQDVLRAIADITRLAQDADQR